MSASDEIKDAIVDYYDMTGVKGSKASDWKRVDKRTLPSGESFRMFENKKLKRAVFTIGDDEEVAILESDDIIYGMSPADPMMVNQYGAGNYVISFETKDRFFRQGHIYDQHQEGILRDLFNLPANINEDSENMFSYQASDYSDLTIHMVLKKLGFQYSRELSDFLTNHIAPPQRSAAQARNASPMLPPFLNPNYSAPLAPASTPAPAPTPSSKAVRPVNKMPGQVFAAQQAQAASNQRAMMAQIGQMAAQLGATGGVQIGNVHIPAAPIGNMQPLVGPGSAPPLPPSGMFNAPGMAAAMPMMAAQWPELANLQPAVQAAFITQRMQNLQGLDQADPSWIDKDDLEKLFFRHRGQQFTIQIERSNVIWMIYEVADQGGYVLEDLFLEPNEELHEIMDSWGILDQMDYDEHELEIIDDRQAYPTPYDLPVPAYQPQAFTPPPPPQQPRAPMVGPAAMNARAGSFTPVQAQAPAAVAPPAPPPGNASAMIRNDAGDKWPEFCKEVWDTYEANKSNLPLDLTWYDRYRDREAQITGLGYEFQLVEYNGVRVLMGYLGRNGEIIENIDLPSAVLDELLKEWGGEWNIDDATQLIYKRKGVDEHGFSFSAQDLWEEVKPFLDSEGWKEAQ